METSSIEWATRVISIEAAAEPSSAPILTIKAVIWASISYSHCNSISSNLKNQSCKIRLLLYLTWLKSGRWDSFVGILVLKRSFCHIPSTCRSPSGFDHRNLWAPSLVQFLDHISDAGGSLLDKSNGSLPKALETLKMRWLIHSTNNIDGSLFSDSHMDL